ncbi:cyclic nucleotide-binding domain-containing protein 2-like [Aplochiton taeniatus]
MFQPQPRFVCMAQLCGAQRFQRAAQHIVYMCRLCRLVMSQSKYRHPIEFNFLESISNQPCSGSDKDLVFDLNHFKLKEVMRKPPQLRTEEEVHLLLNMLSSVAMFRLYSSTLQLLLAKVVRCQRSERRRVVIKKGQEGQSFYFVFSGLLAVTKDQDGSSAFVDKEPILIKKGMSFGDVALIKGLLRNATVVCMEETELMVIDKEDFFANNMDVELRKEFQYRFNFFRSLPLMSSWSSPLIEQMADHSKTEYFRYGRMVVKDTNDMSNVMFIVKGQCDVLRVVDLTTCNAYQRLLKLHAAALATNGKDALSRLRHGEQGKSEAETQQSKKLQRVPQNISDLPRAACFLIDSLHRSATFGLNEYLMPQKQRDSRRFTLVSRSVEILRLERTRFDERADSTALKKLEALQKTYPSDEELCKVFLQHSRWKCYKGSVVCDLLQPQLDLLTSKEKQVQGAARRGPHPGQAGPPTHTQGH